MISPAKRPLVTLVGAFGLVVCMPAQIDSARWWLSPRFRAELGLSAAQSETIERIYREALPGQRVRARKAEAVRATLDRMLADDASDIVIERVIVEAAHADAARWRGRTLMLCAVFRILSPMQRLRLRQSVENRRSAAFEGID